MLIFQQNFLWFFIPAEVSDQPNESEIALGLSDDMLMECGTPESPAVPSLSISLAMVNVAIKANSFFFRKIGTVQNTCCDCYNAGNDTQKIFSG